MNNCMKCEKNLSGAVKSKVKADGSYYLACGSCGNIMEVTVDKTTGLTTLGATLEGTSKKVVAQMIEAKELFAAVGHNVASYIDTMNGTKKSATELKKVDYTAVKSTVKASVKKIVASVAKSVEVSGVSLTVKDSNAIADIIVAAIKKADK